MATLNTLRKQLKNGWTPMVPLDKDGNEIERESKVMRPSQRIRSNKVKGKFRARRLKPIRDIDGVLIRIDNDVPFEWGPTKRPAPVLRNERHAANKRARKSRKRNHA